MQAYVMLYHVNHQVKGELFALDSQKFKLWSSKPSIDKSSDSKVSDWSRSNYLRNVCPVSLGFAQPFCTSKWHIRTQRIFFSLQTSMFFTFLNVLRRFPNVLSNVLSMLSSKVDLCVVCVVQMRTNYRPFKRLPSIAYDWELPSALLPGSLTTSFSDTQRVFSDTLQLAHSKSDVNLAPSLAIGSALFLQLGI